MDDQVLAPPRPNEPPGTAPEIRPEQGLLLPALARRALEEALGGPPLVERFAAPGEAWLHRRAATFVTLTLQSSGQLRGCIGTVRATRTLLEDLCSNTRAAALSDPRFPPLSAEELERDPVRISVSVLSPLRRLRVGSDEELLATLRPGEEGLLLEWGRLGGVYLPQVWRHVPEPADFIRSLKHKAGLAPDFWARDLALWTFTVRSWSED